MCVVGEGDKDRDPPGEQDKVLTERDSHEAGAEPFFMRGARGQRCFLLRAGMRRQF